MNCRDKEIQIACFKPFDGSPSQTINHTVVYDKNGIPIATYFSNREGFIIQESTYLGGGQASIGACAVKDYLYIEGCWVEDGVPDNTRIVVSVYEKGFPLELVGYLEKDGVTIADVSGWTKTTDCKCG